MQNVIRRLGKLLFVLLLIAVLLIAGVVTLLLFSDANHIKPHLHRALAERGLHAQFAGDLNWSIYPTAGITTSDLSLYGDSSFSDATRLASLGKLSLQVDLWTLLRDRHVAVVAVVFEAPEIRYFIDARGNTNWQPVLETFNKPDHEPEPHPQSDAQTEFHIARLDIHQLQVHYNDALSHTELKLQNIGLSLTNVNLNRAPIALESQGQVALSNYPDFNYVLKGELTQTADNAYRFADWELQVQSGPQASAKISGNVELSTAAELQAEANFRLQPMNPRDWMKRLQITPPETANPKALSSASLQGKLLATSKRLDVSELQLVVDRSTINANGHLIFRDALPPAVNADVTVSQINLDEYLPPGTDDAQGTTEDSSEPLNLEFLTQQRVQVSLRVEQAQLFKQTTQQIAATVNIKNNRLELDLQQAAIYQGNATAELSIVNTSPGAKVTAAINADNIDVFDAMTSLELYDQLKGRISARVNATTQGRTTQQLTQQLRAEIQTHSNALQFLAMNVEQRYCDALAQLERKNKITDWPDHTRIAPFEATLEYKQGTVNIQRLYALIQGMETIATGTFAPETGAFNIPLDLAFKDFTAAQKECPLLNAKWRSQKIPLVCKGHLDALASDICKPDYKRLSDKLEDRFEKEKAKLEESAESRAKEIREELKQEARKAEDKAEQQAKESREEAKDKVDEEAKKLLDDLVGEKKAEEIEDKLKNFLNRK